MTRPSTLLRFVLWGAGLLLALRPGSSYAQTPTHLKAGDLIMTGVKSTNTDVFHFVPLVDLAAGTKLKFTDNGWYRNGGFRGGEGIITYTVPTGGLPRGTKVTYSSDAAITDPGFTVTGQFDLADEGDQVLVYQGPDATPKFIYGLSLRKDWTNANSATTSALPAELSDGFRSASLPWSNAYQKQTTQRKGGVNKLRYRFNTRSNWAGTNSVVSNSYSQTASSANMDVEPGIASQKSSQPAATAKGVSQVRTLTYTDANLSNPVTGELRLDGLCDKPAGVRRVLLTIKFSANSLVDPGNGQPSVELHNMGEADFYGKVQLDLKTDYSGIGPVYLSINKQTPEQTYVLDLTQYFTQFVLPGMATRLWIDTPGYGFGPAELVNNARLTATLEESYYSSPSQVVLPSNPSIVPGRLEQELSWQPICFTETYQLQLLKLTDEEVANANSVQSLLNSPVAWRQRATTLDFQTTDNSWKTTLGEGYGTYYYRVRALSNITNVITNPENWGDWSTPVLFRLEPDGSGRALNLANLNWIYSRTFTEGGRVSEKITYANGLLQPRQTLTRLASTQQVIGLQTVQDYVGRDALQSLPVPIVGGDHFLTYKPNLLREFTVAGSTAVPYRASDFDEDAVGTSPSTVTNPAAAKEQGYYDSSAPVYNTAAPTSTTPPLNAGVADAEGHPFARTLFTNDGTNRVREQGSAGLTLGLGQGHTVRTYYAAVAQDELTKLMGKEAPLADKTYKTLTFDPNGTTSVTYQTLDGKIIATALAGQGSSNLTALPATPGPADPRDTISVTMTEKLNYYGIGTNSIGTVGHQLLLMTESNVTVYLKYGLTPATLTDGCSPAVCSTCDYLVTITCYRLEDGAALTPVYSTSKELLASCLTSGTKVPLIGQFTTGAPGTYVVEKKVTAYNSAANSSTTYLDDKVVALQQTYDAYPTQMPWKRTGTQLGILDYLTSTPPRVDSLYQFLSNHYPVQTAADGRQYYAVPFGCNPADKVTIPVLPLCSNGGDCDANAPGFEALFTARWPAGSLTAAMPSFPYSAGAFDDMIKAMLQDNSATGFSGKCAELKACWTAQVEAYEDMIAANNPAVGGPPVDLAQSFLTCAQELLALPCSSQPCTTSPQPAITTIANAPLGATNFYNTAPYYSSGPQSSLCLACLSAAMGQNITSTSQAQSILASSDPTIRPNAQQATNYARCLRQGTSPTITVGSSASTSQQAAAQVTAQLLGDCESRREEFRQDILDRALAKQLTITACEIDKLADELVLKCQANAQVMASDFEPVPNPPANTNPAPMQLTAAAMTRLQRVHLGRALVDVWPFVGVGGDLPGQCSADLTTSPYLDANVYWAPVRPTQAAIQLVGYANEMLRTVNRVTAQRQFQASQPGSQPAVALGCPLTKEGLGEAVLNQFTYIGRVASLAENLTAATIYPGLGSQTGRQSYWAVVGLDNSSPGNQLTFSVYLPSVVGSVAGPPAAGACLPDGEEPVGVPKLPTATAYAPMTSFWLEPVSGPALTMLNIASLSTPYCSRDIVNITSQTNPAEGIFVMVTLKDGSVVEAKLHVPSSTQAGYNVLAWRAALCAAQGPASSTASRQYYACLEWAAPQPIVVPNGIPVPTVPTCEQLQARQLLAAIQSQQQQFKADRLTAYRTRYAQACATPENLTDKLTLRYQLGYHHYTLYYYDRAGQLMKTVPPAGVMPLDLSDPQHPDYPAHRLVTAYTYNSLGQLVRQKTPDGGLTRFYYNQAGQLRFSLNDKQLAEQKYSFTTYDALGRVVSVGESSDGFSTTKATGTDELDGPLAKLDQNAFPVNTFNQTLTTYTTPGDIKYLDDTPQRYLNNRVSYVTAYPHSDDPNPPGSASTYTYYSYDPHGNVEWLCQQLPGLAAKYVRYEYDLISNKVTKVLYQEGQADQFYHQYSYDDDNRLLAVQTSTDGLVWEQDAAYQYYAHGPLQRTMLGDDRVQGLDYAYTLQGWLKAMNHPGLGQEPDPGQDGLSSGAAADAFGMVLGYYRGDYRHQGAWLDGGPHPDLVLAEPDAGTQLYNGNIASWSSNSRGLPTQMPPQFTVEHYRYDQLNRLASSEQRAFTGSSWQPTNQYGTGYSYDPNGNLLSLKRQAGQTGQLMDELSYHYDTSHERDNRLLQVQDNVAAGVSDEDVDDQPAGNYDYDAVGNLIKDTQGGVGISWTPYGKIGRIQRKDGTIIIYRYDTQGNRVSKQVQPAQGDALTTLYVRDATGNIMAVYEDRAGQPLQLVEQPLYGSARVGERKPVGLDLNTPPEALVLDLEKGVYIGRTLGQKYYELSDHLGNVRVVVTDQKTSEIDPNTGQPALKSLLPVLSNFYNYYAFGQLQPGRYGAGNSTAAGGYRYGYNGKEKDNNGELGLTTYDYGFRIYNPGIGKFLSVDPLASSYPWYTPYQFAGNQPIWAIDVDGAEEKVVTSTTGKAIASTVGVVTGTKLIQEAIQRGAVRTVVNESGALSTEILGISVISIARLAIFAVPVAAVALLIPSNINNRNDITQGTITGQKQAQMMQQFPVRKSDVTRFFELEDKLQSGPLSATEDAEYRNLFARGLSANTTPRIPVDMNDRHYLSAKSIANSGKTAPGTVGPRNVLVNAVSLYNLGKFTNTITGSIMIEGREYGLKNEGSTIYPMSGGASDFMDLTQGQIKAIQNIVKVPADKLDMVMKNTGVSDADRKFAEQFVKDHP